MCLDIHNTSHYLPSLTKAAPAVKFLVPIQRTPPAASRRRPLNASIICHHVFHSFRRAPYVSPELPHFWRGSRCDLIMYCGGFGPYGLSLEQTDPPSRRIERPVSLM